MTIYHANPHPLIGNRRRYGFTLVEMAVTLAIISLISGVALFAFRNQGETQDAALANGVQGSLQTALGAMALRLERPANQVFANAAFRQRIIQFAQGSMGPQATLSATGNGVQLQLGNSGRTVTYGLNAAGDIVIQTENFDHFTVDTAGQLKG
jgi:prepilin-type N-terminal cleavage/methylation domain-containing protein